jgi:hypothetical protein
MVMAFMMVVAVVVVVGGGVYGGGFSLTFRVRGKAHSVRQ